MTPSTSLYDDTGFSGTAKIPASSPLLFASGKGKLDTGDGTVDGKIDSVFDLESISGSLNMNYSDLTSAILQVESFEYSGGRLNTLTVTKAKVQYKAVAMILFENATWDGATSILTFNTAHLDFGSDKVVLDVEDFELNLSEARNPVLSVGEFDGHADFDQLAAHINGSILPDKFDAHLDAKFMAVQLKGGITIAKATVAGTTDSYNYGMAEVSFEDTNGVQLGELPIKLQKLSGDAGYNQKHPEINGARVWVPERGTFVLGAGAGFCDSLKIVAIDGHIELEFNKSNQKVDIEGAIKYPASGNRYMVGGVAATYVLGNSNITGSATGSFNVPAVPEGGGTTGALVSIAIEATSPVKFDVGGDKISINGQGLKGNLLKVFAFNGGFSMSGTPADPSTFGGSLNLDLAAGGAKAFAYPAGTQHGEGTGFGVWASLKWDLTGHLDLAVAHDDFACNSSTKFSAKATGSIRYQSSLGDWETAGEANVICVATMDKQLGSSVVKISGDFKFYYGELLIGSVSVSDYALN